MMRELDLRLRAHEEALMDLARFDVTVDTTAEESADLRGAIDAQAVEARTSEAPDVPR
jgi:hypothetical protein